jgi:plasmid stabilization system protein ParE
MIARNSRRARDDLAKILEYLDERSPGGARNVKLAIERAIGTIAENPGLGHPTGRGATRGMPVGRNPYLVYWTVEAGEVWLVHIRHGARKPWPIQYFGLRRC